MFNCSYPRISSKIFKECDWFDFYRDAKEDIPPNITESRGHIVYFFMFVDADLAGDKSSRRSQIRILIFINKAPIHWYSKRQVTVNASTFGSKLCTMKAFEEMV